jgi:hypothetical protein
MIPAHPEIPKISATNAIVLARFRWNCGSRLEEFIEYLAYLFYVGATM